MVTGDPPSLPLPFPSFLPLTPSCLPACLCPTVGSDGVVDSLPPCVSHVQVLFECIFMCDLETQWQAGPLPPSSKGVGQQGEEG